MVNILFIYVSAEQMRDACAVVVLNCVVQLVYGHEGSVPTVLDSIDTHGSGCEWRTGFTGLNRSALVAADASLRARF